MNLNFRKRFNKILKFTQNPSLSTSNLIYSNTVTECKVKGILQKYVLIWQDGKFISKPAIFSIWKAVKRNINQNGLIREILT